LQKLRQLGEDLIEESDHDKETTKDIKAQLQDFDDCWNQVAKRVIDEKEKVLILLILTVFFSCVNTRGHICEGSSSWNGNLGFPIFLEISKPVKIYFNRVLACLGEQ